MPHRVETTDAPKWKYPGGPKKIKALMRKRLNYVRKKKLQYKHRKGKLKIRRKLDYVRKGHKYHKLKKRRLK